MKLILMQILLALTTCIFAQTSRNRVQIQNGTLVTDKGALLRGAYISTDVTDIIPTKETIAGIKKLGLNCVHLYAECYQFQTAGERQTLVDSIVNMTGNDSLYLILTIGGCYENGQFDSAFVHDFWDIYAPRYAEKKHVMYEIMNEPFSWSSPYDSITLEMEKWAYNLIRSLAPETHIMLMSYANAVNDTSIIEDILKLGTTIDWSNASVAMHGYGALSQDLIPFIRTLKDSGIVLTFTEPESIENAYANLASTRIFEQEFVSYAHFVGVQEMIDHPAVFKSRIESSEIRWTSDFGTWPESITEIACLNPYQTIEAAFYDDGSGFDILFPETDLGYISNNDYTAYYNLDFDEGPASFEAECSSAGSGGNIELHLDSLNGALAGTCAVSPTGDWEVYETYSCTTSPFDGIHKLYMVFKGGVYDLFNLRGFVFKKPVSLPNHLLDLSIRLYPNPARDILNICVPENSNLELYNMKGQLMTTSHLSANNNSISLNQLPSGNYIARIISNNHVVFGKLNIE